MGQEGEIISRPFTKLSRRNILKGGVGLAAGSAIATIAQGLSPASAETPVPPPKEVPRTPTPKDPLDVQIEEARTRLQKIQADKPKKKVLDDINNQIELELTPPKTPIAPDSKDAQIADLRKQLDATQKQFETNKKEFDDFRRAIASDPSVKVYTDAQLKQYIDSGVEIKFKAKEAGEAGKKAEDATEIERNKADAKRLKDQAQEDATGIINKANTQATAIKDQALAMRGKADLPVLGEVAEAAALTGAAAGGFGLLRGVEGIVSRVVRGRRENRVRAQERAAFTQFLKDEASITTITPAQVNLLMDNGYTIEELRQMRTLNAHNFPLFMEGILTDIHAISTIADPVARQTEKKNRLKTEEGQFMNEWSTANPEEKRYTEMALQRIFLQLGGAGRP